MAKEEPVCAPESMGSEDTLFLLYTSGSTGKPKGLVHTQAGYLLYAAVTHRVRHHPGDIRGRGEGRLDWGGHNCCCVQEQSQESWHQCGCRGGLAGQCLCLSEGLGSCTRVSCLSSAHHMCAEPLWGLPCCWHGCFLALGAPDTPAGPSPI